MGCEVPGSGGEAHVDVAADLSDPDRLTIKPNVGGP
jgi:hypothetical protein